MNDYSVFICRCRYRSAEFGICVIAFADRHNVEVVCCTGFQTVDCIRTGYNSCGYQIVSKGLIRCILERITSSVCNFADGNGCRVRSRNCNVQRWSVQLNDYSVSICRCRYCCAVFGISVIAFAERRYAEVVRCTSFQTVDFISAGDYVRSYQVFSKVLIGCILERITSSVCNFADGNGCRVRPRNFNVQSWSRQLSALKLVCDVVACNK